MQKRRENKLKGVALGLIGTKVVWINERRSVDCELLERAQFIKIHLHLFDDFM
jgi:fido (protein-threonine AMPylation protein)